MSSEKCHEDDADTPQPPPAKKLKISKDDDEDRTFVTKPSSACTICRRKKVKCEGGIPCQECIKRGMPQFCLKQLSVKLQPEQQVVVVIDASSEQPLLPALAPTAARSSSAAVGLKRGRPSFACGYCKSQRIKCDGRRPCKKCTNRNRAEQCTSEVSSSFVDEHPIELTPKVNYEDFVQTLADNITLTDEEAFNLVTNFPWKWAAFSGMLWRWTNDEFASKIRQRITTQALAVSNADDVETIQNATTSKLFKFHEVHFQYVNDPGTLFSQEQIDLIAQNFGASASIQTDLYSAKVLFLPHKDDGQGKVLLKYECSLNMDDLLETDYVSFLHFSRFQWNHYSQISGNIKVCTSKRPWNFVFSRAN
eukprot:TRINITY_DN12136_c0_g1_i2.p1 TRINITY_DN12136_c0_g1~~TRINITY_DN12136_c0_g1_i2.p1  ORF type:complete len:364 (-),score=65.86 TRINITY_DN12136_c0_g1_i2:642-1733(-)